jgi:pyruvate,orthophosphate dikinase
VPEARVLRAWADELGIAIDRPKEAERTVAAEAAPAPEIEDCVRTLSTKGFASTEVLATALRSSPEQVAPLTDRLVADELATTDAGALRLTDTGKARAAELLAADREAWGIEPANAALDAFLALDRRMKEAVTDWQLRPTDGGEPEVNDHTDPAYDERVLADLAALHEDASAWLGPLASACPRLDGYRERLSGAIEQARAGDGRYVASPRVDSYHGIWFELHEDLIGLAGRTREDEAAAGRA